jgi:hypothetical protein
VSDPPLVLGPVYGLRTWLVEGPAGAERLVGAHTGVVWPGDGALLEAACPVEPTHAPPAPGCTCGLYAWHPSKATARRVCGVRREVPGVLEAAGALEVHDDGFRAERGRPHALVLLPGRNEGQITRLADAYGAEVLRLPGPDALAAHCAAHGLGLPPRVVAELVGADNVARDRRARRRRAATVALRLAAVALLLAALGAIVDGGTEHGKVLNGRAGEVRVP